MKMKKLFLLFVLAGAMPLSMMAQDDDLYFTPSKKVAKTSSSVENKPAYYVGSNRDVDEYNRRGKFRSTYQKIGVDSLGNDIIMWIRCGCRPSRSIKMMRIMPTAAA